MNAHAKMPTADPDTPLTPGRYMQRCRKRAGVSVKDCAKLISLPEEVNFTRRAIHQMEVDWPGNYGHLVRCLRSHAAFPFDMGTFTALCAATFTTALNDEA